MLYLIVIIFCMATISVLNIFFTAPMLSMAWWECVLAVVIMTVAVIVVDLILGLIIRRFLPAKWFSVDKKLYSASKKEGKFYDKLKIKKWKDKVLELGQLTNFSKKKIADPNSAEYIERYIVEANYGVAIHLSNIILGFLIIFLFPLRVWLYYGFPVGVVNAFLSYLPLIILRYNLPKLHALYKFNTTRKNTQK